MGVWVCIVEGDGEKDAVPLLLRRLVHGKFQRYTTHFKPYNAKGRSNLTDLNRFQRFLNRALIEKDLEAIIVVLDAEDDCPKDLALRLTGWARQRNPHVPGAIVIANRCYEAWLLAGHCWDNQPEAMTPRAAKARIAKKMGRASYKETIDQSRLTAQMTIWRDYRHCCSFRRFVNAVRQLIQAIDNQNVIVTP